MWLLGTSRASLMDCACTIILSKISNMAISFRLWFMYPWRAQSVTSQLCRVILGINCVVEVKQTRFSFNRTEQCLKSDIEGNSYAKQELGYDSTLAWHYENITDVNSRLFLSISLVKITPLFIVSYIQGDLIRVIISLIKYCKINYKN